MTPQNDYDSYSQSPDLGWQKARQKAWLVFLALLLISTIAGPAAADRPASGIGSAPAVSPMWLDGREFAGVSDPAEALFASAEMKAVIAKVGDTSKSHGLLDRVFTLEHHVPVGQGRTLFVTESFTLRSWLRWQHRAVLFLSGSAFRGNHWDIPVDGYDGGAMVASRRMFAFNVDYLGVGDSFKPVDGTEATFEANKEVIETLVRYIRFFRLVPKVDLVGEGYGGSIAAEIAADASRIRSVSMSSMLYDDVSGGPLTDPAFVALLQSSPDGYFFLPGEASFIFLTGAPQGVFDYIGATQSGFYPTPNFLVAVDRPFFDPSIARAPGLVIYGGNDFIAPMDSIQRLAEDYGSSGAIFAFDASAGHAPRTEGPTTAAWYWNEIFDFID